MGLLILQTRTEKDSTGNISVPIDAKWAAQTQRSLENFDIGCDYMPLAMIWSLAQIKKAAAKVSEIASNILG